MTDRRTSGRAAKSAGAAAEAFWEAQHEMALYLGVLVHVQHNEPATKMVHGRLIYSKKSAADFTATLSDGRTFAAESKSVIKRLARSAIQPLQAKQLDAVSKAGGLAFLLVEFHPSGTIPSRFAIPWLEVPWRRLRSAESIGVEDVLKYAVRPNECYLRRGVPVAAGVVGRRFPRE